MNHALISRLCKSLFIISLMVGREVWIFATHVNQLTFVSFFTTTELINVEVKKIDY